MYIQHKRVRLEQSKDEGGEKKTLTETVVFSQRVDATGQGTLPAPYQSKNQMKYQSYLNSIVLEEEYSAVFLDEKGINEDMRRRQGIVATALAPRTCTHTGGIGQRLYGDCSAQVALRQDCREQI